MPPFDDKSAADIFTDTTNSSAPPSPNVVSKMMVLPPPRPRTNSSNSVASPAASPRMTMRKQSTSRLSPPTPPRQRRGPSGNSSSSDSSGSSNSRRYSTKSYIDNAQPPMDLQKSLYRAIHQNIRAYGEKHPTTAQMHIQMGNFHFRQSNLEGAALAYICAVEASDGVPGEPLSTAFLNLGTVYWRSGEIQKAIYALHQALMIHELDVTKQGKSMGESTTAASAYHQLGLCYALSSEWTNAINLLERARSIRARVAGPVAVGHTLDAIGKVYSMQGRYDEAMACHQQALTLLKTAGVTATATTLQNTANVHIATSMLQSALTVLEEVCKAQREVGIETSTKAALHAQTLTMMAKLYEETGSPEQAAQLRREADVLNKNASVSCP